MVVGNALSVVVVVVVVVSFRVLLMLLLLLLLLHGMVPMRLGLSCIQNTERTVG